MKGIEDLLPPFDLTEGALAAICSSGESLKPLKDVDAANEVEIMEMCEMEDHSRVHYEFVVALSKLQTLLLTY